VRFNCEVTPAMLSSDFSDYQAICTTVSKPKQIEAFACFKQTMTADDILSGKGFPGRKVVILGGGSVGCETADYLAPLIDDRFPANREVTVIEMTDTLMAGEGGPAKSALTQRLMRKGVNLVLNGIVTNVDETTITYQKDGVEHTIFDADTLVFAVGYTPVPVIHEKAVLIGDCDKVGNLKDAITGAYTAVKNL
ncbi:MAG: NAD(P)/FAD-dependent oxidoreductase, partial [Eubacterium sp.]|nr:NAD(P)/FAD-dependent oxidoreductase [Eubacterium sp.]